MVVPGLVLGALAAGALYGCMETGPDAPPRTNGCLYLGCETPSDGGGDGSPSDASDSNDAGESSDAPLGLLETPAADDALSAVPAPSRSC